MGTDTNRWLHLHEITPEILEEYKAISPDIASRVQVMIDKEHAHQKRMTQIHGTQAHREHYFYYAYLILAFLGAVTMGITFIVSGSYAAALLMCLFGVCPIVVGAVTFLHKDRTSTVSHVKNT